MRIIAQEVIGGPEVLEVREVERPQPQPGEVLVRVGATGLNPVDIAVRTGAYPLLGDPPFVLGWDVAGEVVEVGADVTQHAVGHRIFGMPRFPKEARAYAEYVAVPSDELVATPSTLDDTQAAAIPLAGLTAWQALVSAGQVEDGQRVLIHAAGGGVGHLAVQIAKARGAHVLATASSAKIAFVRSLGADEVIDYRDHDFATGLAPVDMVLDPLAGEITERSIRVLKPGGLIATLIPVVAGTEAAAAQAGVRHAAIQVVPDRAAMLGLSALVASGALMPHVSASYPLEQVADAHVALSNRPMGKVVLVP